MSRLDSSMRKSKEVKLCTNSGNMRIEYLMPQLGNIRIQLYPFAKDIFNLLNCNGEIDRLKQLQHLGELCKTLEGAHHTRWDYIILFLFLLEEFRRNDLGLGWNSTNLPEEFPSNITPHELFQAVCLLSNAGHLHGTFETERLLLKAISRNDEIKTAFINLLPTEIKSIAEKIVKQEDVSQFYKILSIQYLQLCKNGDESAKVLARKVLSAFYWGSCRRSKELRKTYASIRQLSYLALDMHYVPVGLSLNIPAIVQSSREFSLALLRSSDSDYRTLFSAINEHLAKTVYVSPKAGWAMAECERSRYDALRKQLQTSTNRKLLKDSILNLRKGASAYRVRPKPHYFVFRITPIINNNTRPKVISGQERLQKEMGRGAVVSIPGIFPESANTAFIYFPNFLAGRRRGRTAKAFCTGIVKMAEGERKLIQMYKKGKVPPFVGLKQYERYAQSVVKCAMYLAFGDQFRIEITEDGPENGFTSILCHKREDLQKIFASLVHYKHARKLDKDRLHEIQQLKNYLLRRRAFPSAIALCFGRVHFVRREIKSGENRVVREIDGVIIVVDHGKMQLKLFESKNKSHGSTEAKKVLKTIPEQIPISSRGKIGRCIAFDKKCAVLSITIE